MAESKKQFTDIDDYISYFPVETQEILQQVRTTIKAAAPTAEETISYQIPAFRYKGILVRFAGYKKHIGFYPDPSGIEKFKDALSEYESGRGSVKFPLNKPVPYDLIGDIVKFRVRENSEKAAKKKR